MKRSFPGMVLLWAGATFLAGCAAPEEAENLRLADIHGLAVDPSDSGRLFVATHHGLFRSDDGEWSAVTEDPFDMMGFTMHPADSSLMYASGHPAMGGLLGFARSTDAGETWDVIALAGQVDFHAMTLSLAQPDRAWGSFRDAVQRSDDAGLHWSAVSQGTPPTILGLASDAASADVLYAAGPAGVHVSRNGGATFDVLYATEGGASAIASTTSDSNVLAAYFPNGGLQRSTDGGATWTSLGLGFGAQDGAAAIAIDPTDPDTIYAGSYRASLRKTTDAGATWSDIAP